MILILSRGRLSSIIGAIIIERRFSEGIGMPAEKDSKIDKIQSTK